VTLKPLVELTSYQGCYALGRGSLLQRLEAQQSHATYTPVMSLLATLLQCGCSCHTAAGRCQDLTLQCNRLCRHQRNAMLPTPTCLLNDPAPPRPPDLTTALISLWTLPELLLLLLLLSAADCCCSCCVTMLVVVLPDADCCCFCC